MIKLKVADETITQFNKISIDLKFDTVASSFSFDSIYNSQNPQHKRVFYPLSYADINIDYNNTRLLSGFAINQSYTSDSTTTLVNIQGYSRCGIIQNLSIPLDAYPLQYDNISLRDLCDKIMPYVEVTYSFSDSASQLANEPIEEITADPGTTAFSLLTDVASQKGIITRHTVYGGLLFDVYKPGESKLNLREGDIHIEKITLGFDGNKFHSPLTAIGEMSFYRDGIRESTIKNDFINKKRPIISNMDTVEDVDSEAAVKQIRSAELKNIAVTITLDKIDLNNYIVMPGEVISLYFPSVNINKVTRFMVFENSIKQDAKGESSVLTLILEDALTGAQPASFW